MLIEIRGVQFVNKGAELMLHACLEQIKIHWPQAQIALAPNKNSPYRERSLLGALQKLPLRFKGYDFNALSYWLPKRFRTFLRHWLGVVFEADIDWVMDASGFAYGDQWGGRNITVLTNEIIRLKRHQKGYVLLPQAFGPFAGPKEQKCLQAALPDAWLVCPRDEASYQHLHHLLGDRDNLQQFADFTNLVKPSIPNEPISKPICLIIPNAAMLSSKNRNLQWRQHYLRVLELAVQTALAKQYEPVLLNHEGEADAAICLQIAKQFTPELRMITESDPRKVKGWIAVSQLVVCSRFHGCVSALSSGVPCIGTSWSHKYEALFAEYHQSDCLLQPDVLADHIEALFDNAVGLASTTQAKQAVAFYQQQSMQLWQQVVQAVAEGIQTNSDEVK
ncbi:MAG: polysaccharide pyruvyl transferase family protein [Gammaproteobacteria bacterium]|nr:polysaccharide pyruvyl transferase family protein [Gammaproteobacteria bacterium]